MPCKFVKLEGGGVAIVKFAKQRTKPCASCGRPSTKLCDYPLTGAKAGKTCDRAMCDKHSVHVGTDTDYCIIHSTMMKQQALL